MTPSKQCAVVKRDASSAVNKRVVLNGHASHSVGTRPIRSFAS
jgi:hypothetical protein